jgi:cyanamide hydratase
LGSKIRNVNAPAPQTAKNIELPQTPLAKTILGYARKELPLQTFTHGLRVYYYGAKALD